MLESPEARAKLRRKLETWPDNRKSPVTINQGLELLDIVKKQDNMINWLIGKIGDFCIEFESCNNCPGRYVCNKKAPSFKEGWREAAREAVEKQNERK